MPDDTTPPKKPDAAKLKPPKLVSPLPPTGPAVKDTLASADPAVTLKEEGHDELSRVFKPAPATNPVVEGLIAAGLYQRALSDRHHQITCPWESDHAPGANGQTTYSEPDHASLVGRFRCPHEHKETLTTHSLLERLGIPEDVARTRDRIILIPGDTYLAAAAIERKLAEQGDYFHAGGPIQRIVTHDGRGVSVEIANDQTLITVSSAKVDWLRPGRDGLERVDVPHNVIQLLKNTQDRRYLRPLNGLARQPYFGPDEKLITTPGYNSVTGIYADFDRDAFGLTDFSRERAEFSLARLKWLLLEFPFASDADRSAALGAMLTAVMRTMLPHAPAISCSATGSGSGKSYLALLIALLAGPGEPHNVSYPTKADEATKVVLAMLMEKPSVILFDDMQTDWLPFGAINKAITSATVTERLLGSSRTATARTNVLILGTGNNIEPQKDMRRRVVSIYLAPKSKTPSLNTYNNRPVEYVRKNRAAVVEAALTIVGAFIAAGKPLTEAPSIGTFDDWSLYCRQPLMWLGEPDPAQNLIEQVTNDSDLEALAEFLGVWRRCFHNRSVTVRKVISEALENAHLMDAIADLPVMDGRHINPGRLGYFLKKNRGRRVDGVWIETGDSSERRSWRVCS